MTSDISTPLIVVGVDGSAGSREALQWAVAQAELSGAAVQAVMAWRLPEAYAVVSRDYEADARHELQTAIEETLGPDQRSRVTSLVTPRPARPCPRGRVAPRPVARRRQSWSWGTHREICRLGQRALCLPRRMPGSGRPTSCVVVRRIRLRRHMWWRALRSVGSRAAVQRSLTQRVEPTSEVRTKVPARAEYRQNHSG